jgi:hypothetical protein
LWISGLRHWHHGWARAFPSCHGAEPSSSHIDNYRICVRWTTASPRRLYSQIAESLSQYCPSPSHEPPGGLFYYFSSQPLALDKAGTGHGSRSPVLLSPVGLVTSPKGFIPDVLGFRIGHGHSATTRVIRSGTCTDGIVMSPNGGTAEVVCVDKSPYRHWLQVQLSSLSPLYSIGTEYIYEWVISIGFLSNLLLYYNPKTHAEYVLTFFILRRLTTILCCTTVYDGTDFVLYPIGDHLRLHVRDWRMPIVSFQTQGHCAREMLLLRSARANGPCQ